MKLWTCKLVLPQMEDLKPAQEKKGATKRYAPRPRPTLFDPSLELFAYKKRSTRSWGLSDGCPDLY